MLSDIDGLYTKDPKKFKNAEHIRSKNHYRQNFKKCIKKCHRLWSGGMITKIEAAKICMASGCRMILTKGSVNNPLSKLEKKNLHCIYSKYK